MDGPRPAASDWHHSLPERRMMNTCESYLALMGDPLRAEIAAKAYMARAIAAADGLSVGHEHVPTDYFPMLRTSA